MTSYISFIFLLLVISTSADENSSVLIVILASNEEHLLPVFFGHFEDLTYPKSLITLWILSDHNRDNTPHMIDVWVAEQKSLYKEIFTEIRMVPTSYEVGETWPKSRYENLIQLKERALIHARNGSFSFIFYLDTDVIIGNTNLIQDLIYEDVTLIAPCMTSRSIYSNFWGAMDDRGYYLRTNEYLEIVGRKKNGTFPVALIHSAVLIRLDSKSDQISFLHENLNISGVPMDDIIIFAKSSSSNGIEQFITNKKVHGWMLSSSTVEEEISELLELKILLARYDQFLKVSESLRSLQISPTRDSLGIDEIYLINLLRRPERLTRMEYCFELLGIRYKHVHAVDGLAISQEGIPDIKQLPEYLDPYSHRNMTFGEIGCFLSHYNTWQRILEDDSEESIVFEDDVHFEPNFRTRFQRVLKQIRGQGLDFAFLGYKNIKNSRVERLDEDLLNATYVHWTIGYYITKRGARILLDGEPLSKIIPVDEYIPIMYDHHPEKKWKEAFTSRNLRAALVSPPLVYPTLFTGEGNYISDTESSPNLYSETSGSHRMDKTEL